MSRRGLARYAVLALVALALVWPLAAGAAGAGENRHGLSAFGELKYPPGFKNFDYVNPDAPKGGQLSMIGTAGLITFNSFNGFILKGDAAQGLSYLFDSLMVRADDEPDAVYGLVAETVELADDRSTATFNLRKEARFADGSELTAEDVVFSFETLKEKGHPSFQISLRDVTQADALGHYRVRFSFTGRRTRDLPLIVATLPIFSKAYYAGREFDQTTLDPPLGSGPYEIADYQQGRFVIYQLRDDYWAKDLPVNRGKYNFAQLRYEYFRDRTAEFEALKAGAYDLREEFTSKTWATEYDVAPVRAGNLIRDTLPDDRPSGAQGFFINTRRDKFQDRRVRRALDLAFDFQWTNKNMFYGLYQRTASFFENSEMKATGKPGPDELALLEPFRGQVPDEVFGEPYTPPVTDGSGQDRGLLRRAAKLLNDAGWTIQNGVRANEDGTPLTIEFLIFSPSFERVIAPYVKNLKLLGIAANARRVDPAQYQERVKSFDFDITTQRYVLRATPGIELRSYWGSEAAAIGGSQNLSGIRNPAIDALIETIIEATSRSELVTAARALDRVLRAEHYWVPHWYKASHHVAYWNKFSRPDTKPRYDRGIIETWWVDQEKAAALDKAR